MRALALLNPSSHGFGSLQRRRPFGSSGGLLPTVRCFFATFQHRSDSVVTPSSPITVTLDVGFRFTARALALSLLQQRRRTLLLGFHSSMSSIHHAGLCTRLSSITVYEGLKLVLVSRSLFSKTILWDPIRLWDPGSIRSSTVMVEEDLL